MNQDKNISPSNAGKYFIDRHFKYVPPLFITIILLVGHYSYGILNSYWTILSSILAAVITELILARVFLGHWKNPASGYISGISVGILIRSTMIWPYVVTAVISIMTKYIFRYKNQHIFNPSNFGISWMLFAASWSVAGLSVQWGNQLLPMVVIWPSPGYCPKTKQLYRSRTPSRRPTSPRARRS